MATQQNTTVHYIGVGVCLCIYYVHRLNVLLIKLNANILVTGQFIATDDAQHDPNDQKIFSAVVGSGCSALRQKFLYRPYGARVSNDHGIKPCVADGR